MDSCNILHMHQWDAKPTIYGDMSWDIMEFEHDCDMDLLISGDIAICCHLNGKHGQKSMMISHWCLAGGPVPKLIRLPQVSQRWTQRI